jgi:hypothetical protein
MHRSEQGVSHVVCLHVTVFDNVNIQCGICLHLARAACCWKQQRAVLSIEMLASALQLLDACLNGWRAAAAAIVANTVCKRPLLHKLYCMLLILLLPQRLRWYCNSHCTTHPCRAGCAASPLLAALSHFTASPRKGISAASGIMVSAGALYCSTT